jgi:hypothetical protein
MRLLFALLLLILVGYAAYLGAIWGGEQYALLDPAEQPRAALIGALTILVLFILSGAIRSGSKELAQQGFVGAALPIVPISAWGSTATGPVAGDAVQNRAGSCATG